jgi:hypothetical protein
MKRHRLFLVLSILFSLVGFYCLVNDYYISMLINMIAAFIWYYNAMKHAPEEVVLILKQPGMGPDNVRCISDYIVQDWPNNHVIKKDSVLVVRGYLLGSDVVLHYEDLDFVVHNFDEHFEYIEE